MMLELESIEFGLHSVMLFLGLLHWHAWQTIRLELGKGIIYDSYVNRDIRVFPAILDVTIKLVT
jgi:hypothetical protein